MSGRTLAAKLRLAAIPLSAALAATACGGGGGAAARPDRPPAGSAPATSTTRASASIASPAPTPTGKAVSCVNRLANGMTDRQRVGQLFMMGVNATGPTAAELGIARRDAVGSVFLMGHTNEGVSGVRAATRQAQTLSPTVDGIRTGLLVSTDQEGGKVQVLNGPGFSAIPSAVDQGRLPASRLQSDARQWGEQLRSAGVNVNLAPVVDIVPRSQVAVNQPIGQLQREYGNDPATAARGSSAVVRGLAQAGVYSTLKHFPSLGEVRGNTDFSSHVVDTVTTRDGTFLIAYRSGIAAGARFVMASLATYQRIDPANPSAFSSTLLHGVLRDTLGFRGVVISDDMGQAAAVQSVPAGQRAVRFLTAGGDMALTVKPATVDAMTSAVLARMRQDPAFRSTVNDALHRVLQAKLDAGLLGCSG